MGELHSPNEYQFNKISRTKASKHTVINCMFWALFFALNNINIFGE